MTYSVNVSTIFQNVLVAAVTHHLDMLVTINIYFLTHKTLVAISTILALVNFI